MIHAAPLIGRVLTYLGVGLLATIVFPSMAQVAYPSKPLQMIVPFPPGGPLELLARAFAQTLDHKLGQRVLVINREGGSTAVGMNALANAPGDGYTLAYGPVTALTVHLHWMKGLQFNLKTFTPICQTFENIFILAAKPNSRFSSFDEVVAEGKAHPGQLAYGHPGISSSPHLAGAELFQNAGVQARDVAFRGEPAMLPTLMNGDLELVVATTSFVTTQHLRALAVFGEKRLPQFPDVPTVKELGYKVNPSGYGGLFVRSDVAPDKIALLERACQETMADPAFQEMAQRQYQATDFLGHAAFSDRIRSDYRSKEQLLKNVKLDR